MLYDRPERFRVQTSAADQCAANSFFRHQTVRILGFYRSAIKNAQFFSEPLAEGLGRFSANQHVRVGSELRSGGLTCSTGPYPLLRPPQPFPLLSPGGAGRAQALPHGGIPPA